MALSNPIGRFGAHAVLLYNRTDHVPFAYLRVIGDVTPDYKIEKEKLLGGSQLFAFDSAEKSIDSTISFTCREFPDAVVSKMLGGALTTNAAEAGGATDEFANHKGTSVFNATTGIATVTVTPSTGAANLKDGKYVVKCTAAATIDLYLLSDADADRGTDAVFQNDYMKLNSSAITITGTSGTTDDAITGLRFTGGSGTVGMTIGETATFVVRKPNTSSTEIVFGQMPTDFQEFGAIFILPRNKNGDTETLEFYRVVSGGMALPFKEKGWAEWTGSLDVLYDSTRNAVAVRRRTMAA
jgi:hypothetical protein